MENKFNGIGMEVMITNDVKCFELYKSIRYKII